MLSILLLHCIRKFKAMPSLVNLLCLWQFHCMSFMSCGSLLAKRRGLRGPIEWDDDIDFTVVFRHREAFCEALEAMKKNRGQLEDAMGLKVLILGTNDRQVTVKVAPRLAPDATVSKQALQRSRSYMLQSGAIFSAGLRSLSQQAVSVEFGRAGDRQRRLQSAPASRMLF